MPEEIKDAESLRAVMIRRALEDDDPDTIDPIGLAFGLLITGGLLVGVAAVLIKFAVHAWRWAIQ